MVASIIRTIFAQPDTEHVFAQFDEVTRMLARSHPKVAEMLERRTDDVLAFCGFPQQHWRQIWSTNPLERVNKEIKRRTDVVGTFPNPAALLRLAGHVLIEQHDEWDGADRRYFSEALHAAPERPTTAGGGDPRTDRGIIKQLIPHGVEKLHHSAGRALTARYLRLHSSVGLTLQEEVAPARPGGVVARSASQAARDVGRAQCGIISKI